MILGLSSCNDFLETTPTDFLSPTNYYQTPQHLEFARASVYDILGNGNIYGSSGLYLLAWEGDEGYMNRATLTTGPWNYFYSTADPYSTGFWTALWQGVNRANVVLANLDRNPDIDIKLRDKIRGEVLFLRGYYYFLLVQYYGGVPIKIEPTASVNEVSQARNSVKEVYDQIVADMEAAEPLVPNITELGFGGAVSKSAVRGLLARVNLTMAGHPLRDQSRYAEAKKWAKMVIDDPVANHAMNPYYPEIFMNLAGDIYDIKESIFEVEFYGNGLNNHTEAANQGWINGPAIPTGAASGRADSYVSITAKFYNAFEPGDSRKFWNTSGHFAYTNTQVNGSKDMRALPTTELAKYAIRPGKWRREYERFSPKMDTRTTPENVPILRFTDVLLMYAEAENAINGPTQEVIDIVNSVRWRGWAKGVKTITVTNGGSGYSSTAPPDVVISNGQGQNAEATATVDNTGKVTAITLKRDPTGVDFYLHGIYSTPPTITIQGGGGSGATAEATIYTEEDARLSAAKTGSKEAFHQTLIDERLRELNSECLRKADLLRWGIYVQTIRDLANTAQQDAPGTFYASWFGNISEKDLLMPIPANEMSTNLLIEQNPGW